MNDLIDINCEIKPKDKQKVLAIVKSYCGEPYYKLCYYSTNLYEIDKYDFQDYKDQAGFYDWGDECGYYEEEVLCWMPLPKNPFKDDN